MTSEEMKQYLNSLYSRLLEHRYRYYIKADPAISDFEYDYIERYYNFLVVTHSIGKEMDMVDFDINCSEAQAAAKRVEKGTDYHSIWLTQMMPIWKKLGHPKSTTRK